MNFPKACDMQDARCNVGPEKMVLHVDAWTSAKESMFFFQIFIQMRSEAGSFKKEFYGHSGHSVIISLQLKRF